MSHVKAHPWDGQSFAGANDTVNDTKTSENESSETPMTSHSMAFNYEFPDPTTRIFFVTFLRLGVWNVV